VPGHRLDELCRQEVRAEALDRVHVGVIPLAMSSRPWSIQRAHLADVTSLEHEGWKRAHPEFCCRMGIR